MTGVRDGRVEVELLHRWDEASDRFEVVGEPSRPADGGEAVARLAEEFRRRLEE